VARTFNLVARQSGNGRPIAVRAQLLAPTLADDGISYMGVGVTTSSSTPTALSSFAHYDGVAQMVWSTAWWDLFYQQGLWTYGAAGQTDPTRDQMIAIKRSIPLDSNYAVGRYLWAFVINDSASPSGTTVPHNISSSYHIR
jgi:hypothetical protein